MSDSKVNFFMGWKYFNLCECLMILFSVIDLPLRWYYAYFFLPNVKKLRRLGSPFSPDDAGSVDARAGEPSPPAGKFSLGIHMFISF